MIDENFVTELVSRLDACRIPYMICGSVGSSFFGYRRTTEDIDVVIELTAEQLEQFLNSISADWYVNPATARQAVRQKTMFNVIETATGSKADLIPLTDQPFHHSEFDRRLCVDFAGTPVWAASPEDTILSKLQWCLLSDSQRQFRDAFGVALLQWDKLDFEYLSDWAVQLGVQALWDRMQQEVQHVRASGNRVTNYWAS